MGSAMVSAGVSLAIVIYAIWNLIHTEELSLGNGLAWLIVALSGLSNVFWQKFLMWKIKRDEEIRIRFEREGHNHA